MRALLVTVASTLALAACAAGGPRAGAAARGPEDVAGLYRSKCSACHRLYEPVGRSRAEWAAVVPRMAPKAHLSAEERAALLAWLEAHAKDAGASR